MKIFPSSPDLLLAVLLALIGVAVALEGSERVRSTQASQLVGELLVAPGERFYRLNNLNRSAEEKDSAVSSNYRCFGALSSNMFMEEEGWAIKNRGSLFLTLNGAPQTVILRADFNFNSLNQLFGTVIRVTVGERILAIGTLGVRPIEFSVRLKDQRGEQKWNRELPGPVDLVETKPGLFTLSYRPIANLKLENSPLPSLGTSLLRQVAIEKMDLAAPEPVSPSMLAKSSVDQNEEKDKELVEAERSRKEAEIEANTQRALLEVCPQEQAAPFEIGELARFAESIDQFSKIVLP